MFQHIAVLCDVTDTDCAARGQSFTCVFVMRAADSRFCASVHWLGIDCGADRSCPMFQCIDKARDIVDTDLTAMAGESYNRAYAVMVNVQMLSELEEIIQYKLVPERRQAIKEMWWERLKVCGG